MRIKLPSFHFISFLPVHFCLRSLSNTGMQEGRDSRHGKMKESSLLLQTDRQRHCVTSEATDVASRFRSTCLSGALVLHKSEKSLSLCYCHFCPLLKSVSSPSRHKGFHDHNCSCIRVNCRARTGHALLFSTFSSLTRSPQSLNALNLQKHSPCLMCLRRLLNRFKISACVSILRSSCCSSVFMTRASSRFWGM